MQEQSGQVLVFRLHQSAITVEAKISVGSAMWMCACFQDFTWLSWFPSFAEATRYASSLGRRDQLSAVIWRDIHQKAGQTLWWERSVHQLSERSGRYCGLRGETFRRAGKALIATICPLLWKKKKNNTRLSGAAVNVDLLWPFKLYLLAWIKIWFHLLQYFPHHIHMLCQNYFRRQPVSKSGLVPEN